MHYSIEFLENVHREAIITIKRPAKWGGLIRASETKYRGNGTVWLEIEKRRRPSVFVEGELTDIWSDEVAKQKDAERFAKDVGDHNWERRRRTPNVTISGEPTRFAMTAVSSTVTSSPGKRSVDENRKAPYTDSSGATLSGLYYSRALETIHQIGSLYPEKSMEQAQALDVLQSLLNHSDRSLDALEPAAVAGEWEPEIFEPDQHASAEVPTQAIKIAMEIVVEYIHHPAHDMQNPDDALRVSMARQALEMTRDLIGLHGEDIDQIRTFRGQPVFGC